MKNLLLISASFLLFSFIFTLKPEERSVTKSSESSSLTISDSGSGLIFSLSNSEGEVLTGELGVRLPPGLPPPQLLEPCPGAESDSCWLWGDLAQLRVHQEEENCYQLHWSVRGLAVVEDCLDIGEAHWYGGPEERVQHFPLRRDNSRGRVAYLPGDMINDGQKYFGGVAEPVWISSKGAGLTVETEQPLFYSWNQDNSGSLCLSAQHTEPYQVRADTVELSYTLCASQNALTMFQLMAGTFWNLPTGIPDEKMFTDPVWSSWAQYKTEINESVILKFAQDIVDHGFTNSQLEIDDNWESCYGDASFDPQKFPDPGRLVSAVKELGFRTTLWIHPFINTECLSYSEAAFPPNMFLVRDPKSKLITNNGTFGDDLFGDFEGEAYLPGNSLWWQGFAAGYVDFTNAKAAEWWTARLETLRRETGIESFKFDAGEHNWLPSSLLLDPAYPVTSWPAVFSTAYVSTVAQFGGLVEVRTGRRTQHLPIFVRMLDKFSSWGYDNGLKSMVTTLLQFGMVGYVFVLPDMIGGNGYGGAPSRELYIRWLQVNVFMPAMQISYVPWLYDQEVVEHSLNMTRLHAQYSPLILRLARESQQTGAPINRPVWWLDPADQTALALDDEFLLGDELLVAPVLSQSSRSRDVYLPAGLWADGNNPGSGEIRGPTWIYQYEAGLFKLPYFIRLQQKPAF